MKQLLQLHLLHCCGVRCKNRGLTSHLHSAPHNSFTTPTQHNLGWSEAEGLAMHAENKTEEEYNVVFGWVTSQYKFSPKLLEAPFRDSDRR
jgi:hypothetical protein